ncbi:MAG: hypothetical protein VYA86_05695 [Candidatus Thermoplasmatota archaeon]|nr:hypothetical protein [Candidatus Thermoplasmatota archaeon]
MQPTVGPTGPPTVSGPSGPPIAGPSGPPSDVNPAQFDPLAEIEDARARRQDREERLESLEKRRNSARNNVYLFLAITVILGIFSFFPGPIYGDVNDNPQASMGPNQAEEWVASGGDNEYRHKIWDGSGNESSSCMNIYIPPPLPDMGSISEVRIDVTFVSYRYSGSTDFMVGMHDGTCDEFDPPSYELPEGSWYNSTEPAMQGEEVEFTLRTQPGQKCIRVEWVEPVENPGTLLTMDIEVAIYWPRMFTVPIGLITFLMAGFAFIGAQKTGNAYKQLKYPEGRPEKKVEEEVLEAAEAEQRGEQMGVPEVANPENADSSEVEGPSLEQAASSPEQDDAPPQEAKVEENPAAAWTDEQLLSAGWSQDQIDAMRNG